MADIQQSPQDKTPPQDELNVVALDLLRVEKPGSAVIASFTAWLPQQDIRIFEVLWGRKGNGEEWIMLPRRRWTNRNGNTRYSKLIAFGSDRTERAFVRGALRSVRELAERTPR